MKRPRPLWLSAGVLLVAVGCGSAGPGLVVVLADLDEPRGLSLGPDATLCVVEAGSTDSGTRSADPATRYRNHTGAVRCEDAGLGDRRVIERLPYSNNRFSGVSVGATDLSVMNGDLFVLVGEGPDDLARTILRFEGSAARPRVVADFLAYTLANTDPDFYDEIVVTSNPFALLADPTNERFLVTDGATGEVLSVGLDGNIGVYSAVEGHEVLTGLAWGPDGSLFVASFSELPHTVGSGSIVRVEPDGTSKVVADGLTTPIDLGFDALGRLYVLEFVDAADPVHPYEGDSGRLLRLERGRAAWDGAQVLIEGLPHPTALVVGADDDVYISVGGAFSTPHAGAVLRADGLADVEPGSDPISYDPATTDG